MITTPFDEIDAETIRGLLENEVRERKTLDYKRELPGKGDEDKREFLSDVSSFANASGGHIVYGIAEKEGIPTEITGLGDIDLNAETSRLENSVRDNIAPRIQGIHFKPITDLPEGPVLVMGIPKSWAAPHMVTFKNLSRFFCRNNTGKYQLDVDELRSAFITSESLPQRIRRFREERVARILSDEGPMRVGDAGKLILHMIPVGAFESASSPSMSDIRQKTKEIWPSGYTSKGTRFNIDGLLVYSSHAGDPHALAYMQFFRNGVIEAVDGYVVGPVDIPTGNGGGYGGRMPPSVLSISGQEVANTSIDLLKQFMAYLGSANMQPPVFAFLTLTGVRNAVIRDGRGDDVGLLLHIDDYRIDRDVLMLPEIEINDLEAGACDVIKPAIDALWQASGRAFCPYYPERQS